MSLLTIKELSKEKIEAIISRAIEFKNGAQAELKSTVVNMFLEPSTRTLFSFLKAEDNLGMKSHNFLSNSSSTQKGETFKDTILNLQAIGYNNFVVRSTEDQYWSSFTNSKINFINAGDGKSNHPSQALLDAMTIYEEFGHLSNLKILVCGDIYHSRVYQSLKELFVKFNTVVDVSGPAELGGNNQNLSSIVSNYDVIVMLRVQHERHVSQHKIDSYNEEFGLNKNVLKLLKKAAIFMHPGPINQGVEIAEEVDYKHPASRILKQVENGVYIRMAILETVCKNT